MIDDYLNAGYPCIYMVHPDPAMARFLAPKETGWTWDCNEGLVSVSDPAVRDPNITDPIEMMAWLNKQPNTVCFAKNLHFFIDDPGVIQAIQNGQDIWKGQRTMLVAISPVLKLRPEIDRYFQVIDVPFPGVEIMVRIQEYLMDQESIRDLGLQVDMHAAKAACGMTEFEAESAFAYSLIKTRKFCPETIARTKAQTLRRTGFLDFFQPESFSSVGGLTQLKDDFQMWAQAFEPGQEHLPKIRAILLVGVPGTGKSLFAKAAAGALNWPLIRVDMGAMKNSLVGESEANTRNAFKVIDAFGRCIAWCDEIEKSLGSAKASNMTGDVTGSQMGIMLTWMQESKGEWLMIATANDISALPPEFIRRFDLTVFVDLPTRVEREEILRIHLDRYNLDMPVTSSMIQGLEGYTGAEIEKVVKWCHYLPWSSAINRVVPISKTMREEIDALRAWAETRALKANQPEVQLVGKSRAISI